MTRRPIRFRALASLTFLASATACGPGQIVGADASDTRTPPLDAPRDNGFDALPPSDSPAPIDVSPDTQPPPDGPADASVDVPADTPVTSPVVDVSTLTGHLYMGYQGWFSTPDDGSLFHNWHHWAPGVTPSPTALSFDGWPDLTEYPAGELTATDLHYADGSVASLFSSYRADTVDLHVRWMHDYGIDGVHLQRFISELGDPAALDFRDTVTRSLRTSCERYGRGFSVMYDISGANGATVVNDIERDWMHMVDDLGVTTSDRYLHHHGRPVVGLWGFGFTDRPGTPAQAAQLIAWFQTDGPVQYRATLIGGVPSRWRTLTADSSTDPAWAAVYRSYDVIFPWLVGRYANDTDVQAYRRDVLAPDLVAANAAGRDYLPVVFPGFSWLHLMGGTFNQIPRRGGAFWWRQAYEWQSAGCNMLFGAMFDEVDEGTAIFKMAAHRGDSPADAQFLTLDADGLNLPSDWYLRIAGASARMLRHEIPLTATVPITP